MFLPDQVKSKPSDPIPAGSLSPIYETLGVPRRIVTDHGPNFQPGDVVHGTALFTRPTAPLSEQLSAEERAALDTWCPMCKAPCNCIQPSPPLVLSGQGDYVLPYNPLAPRPSATGLSPLELIIFLGLALAGAVAVICNFIGDENALPRG